MYADNNEYEQVMIYMYQESDVIFVANVMAGDVVKITLKHFHIEIHCPGHDKLEFHSALFDSSWFPRAFDVFRLN